jgi:uncharacterized protein YjbI with pentapeptide repeats
MTTHHVKFPSIHGNGGPAFYADADAPTEALAVRSVLEACAAQGVAFERVVLSGISGLDGARLDGLQLTGCKIDNADLSGASLREAVLKDCKLRHVVADSTTHLDDATLDNVEFDACQLDDLCAAGLTADGLRFEFTNARRLDIPNARIHGMKIVCSDLSGWKSRMTYVGWCSDVEQLISTADLTVNEKAAMRALSRSQGDRASAQAYFDTLEAQDAAAGQA